jgi:hypothetical protein
VTGRVRAVLAGCLVATVLALDTASPAAAAPVPAAPAQPQPGPDAREREQARQRAKAAERAAKAAATAARLRRTWESRGRPDRLIILRRYQVDVVTQGRHTSRVARRGGVVTLGSLDRYVPGSWITISSGRARLAATLVLTPGAVLDVGGPIRTLELVGGPDAAKAASIYTGSGRLTLHDVTVTSVDPESGHSVPPEAAGRPFIVVSSNGRLDSADTVISDLGTAPDATGDGRPAVLFNPGSTGSLVRTALLRNSTGLRLSRSRGVRLEEVTARDSTADGIVLRGDRGTEMSDIRAVGNGDNGVVVGGQSSDRPVTGITTAENGAFGMAVVGQTGARITGVTTARDAAGGIRVNRSTDTVITDLTATDQPTGVFTHVNTTGIVLDRVRTTGGRRGLVAEKSTRGLDVVDSTFTGARVTGVALGGQDIDLDRVRVEGARTGVRIERGAGDIRLTGLVVTGGDDGVVATPGTHDVVVTDLVAENVTEDAVRTFSPGARIVGGRITGGATAIDIGAATTITGTTITGAQEGIHSRTADLVHADRITVDTLALGVNSATGSPVVLRDSRVHALESVRGEFIGEGVNDLSLPPLNLLGAIGVPLILLALVLEAAHAVRVRGLGGRRRVPPAVAVSTR